MRSFSSRIIFAEDLTSSSPWAPESLSGAASKAETEAADVPPPPSYEDGLEAGRRLGYERAHAEYEARRQHELALVGQQLEPILHACAQDLAHLQESLAQRVLELAVAVASSVLGSALRGQPSLIIPAVQTALQGLIEPTQPAALHLHPDDLAIVSEALLPTLTGHALELVSDPGLARGGCRVVSRHTDIDARIETRWQQALAALGLAESWSAPPP